MISNKTSKRHAVRIAIWITLAILLLMGGASATWTVGEGGNAWTGNTTMDNTTLNRDTNNIMLRQEVDNYISYWRLDGSSGVTAYDENATANNNGVLANGAAWTTSGKYGNAVSLDGADDVISVNPSSSIDDLNALSFFTYFYHDDTAAVNERIFDKTVNRQFYIKATTQSIEFWVAYSTSALTRSTEANVFNNGQWNSVVVTWDGSAAASNVHIYVNGVEPAYLITTDGVGTKVSDAGLTLYIGNKLELNRGFDGLLDSSRLYNRVLTSNEINQLINNTMKLQGNLTTWYDAGSGNETYQIDINATSVANSNYSVFYRTNGTGAWTAIGTANSTGNQSITLTTKYQNTDVRVQLQGNSTETPELMSITFYDQPVDYTFCAVSGYITNTLAYPLENARVEYAGGSFAFTDAAGYYNISVPSGNREILGRAIGYENTTTAVTISGNTSLNMTLLEFRPPDYTSLIESILGMVVVLLAIIVAFTKGKNRTPKRKDLNNKKGDNNLW